MRSRALALAAIVAGGCGGSGSGGGDCNYIGVVPLDFGEVQVGLVGGASKTLSIDDLGTGPIDLKGIVVGGANAGEFAVVGPGAVESLQPGAPILVDVSFAPSSLGEAQAELDLSGDNCVRTVALSGIGVSPAGSSGPVACTPAQSILDFGNVVVGESLTQPLVVDNCTSEFMLLGDIVGSNFDEFSLAGPEVVSLAPGQTETLSLTYTPTASGLATADLPFEVCAGCALTAVSLTGEGLLGNLGCTPNPSAPNTAGLIEVTCSNDGNWALELTSLSVFDPDGGATLSEGPPLPVLLEPNQGFDLLVTLEMPDGGQPARGAIDACFGLPALPSLSTICTAIDVFGP